MVRWLATLMLVLAGLPSMGNLTQGEPGACGTTRQTGVPSPTDTQHDATTCSMRVVEHDCCGRVIVEQDCPMSKGPCRCADAPARTPTPTPQTPLVPSSRLSFQAVMPAPLSTITNEAPPAASLGRVSAWIGKAGSASHNQRQAHLGVWQT